MSSPSPEATRPPSRASPLGEVVDYGILAAVTSRKADFGLRIFNPDGSEAEKSGNGLRIFARYLHATGRTRKRHFTVETKGGLVTIDLHLDRRGDASAVTVEMGRATFAPSALPCTLPVEELIEQSIEAAGRSFTFTGVSVGIPTVSCSKDRSVLVTGRSAGPGAGARASHDLSQADQCATGGADRRQRTDDSDLGARRRRDASLRIVVLCRRQRGRPSRPREEPRSRQDAGRHAHDRGLA